MTDTVARLRQLEAAATPGPWGDRGALVYTPPGNRYGWQIAGTYGDTAEANAELIAAARNALPQLLDIAEALAQLLDRHVDLVASGDCGFWNVEEEEAVMNARAALAALDSQETE